MTPAQLDALCDVHEYVHSGKGRRAAAKPSTNPAADIAALAAL